MAKRVQILAIDDEGGNAFVLFSDSSSGLSFEMGISLTEEFTTEDALLDFLAIHWPYEEFEQKGKAPEKRHQCGKTLIGVLKNITSKVQPRP